jgi:hypothetical protein
LDLLSGYAATQGFQSRLVVSFVQDQAFHRDYLEMVERGYQLLREARMTGQQLGVASAAPEDKVQKHEATKKEDSQYQEKSHHPDYQIYSLQNLRPLRIFSVSSMRSRDERI